MNPSKPWKLVLLLAGIFLAGGVVGGAVTLHFVREFAQRRAEPEQWGPARLRMLAHRLELTPAQIEQLRPVVRRNMDDLAHIRQDGMRDTRRVLQRMEQDIAAVLTPEQREKFARLNAELRERSRQMMERRRMERRGPGAGDGPPPPPPDGRP